MFSSELPIPSHPAVITESTKLLEKVLYVIGFNFFYLLCYLGMVSENECKRERFPAAPPHWLTMKRKIAFYGAFFRKSKRCGVV
jgi:hypothetical protein